VQFDDNFILSLYIWFVLGIFYGIGYCPLTDWHWQVLEKSGNSSQVNSYIQYLIERLFDLSVSARTVDTVTLISYVTALLLSVYANFIFNKKFKINSK